MQTARTEERLEKFSQMLIILKEMFLNNWRTDPVFLDSVAPFIVSCFFGMKEQQQKEWPVLSNFNSFGLFFKHLVAFMLKCILL